MFMRFNQNIGIHLGVTVGLALLMCVPAMNFAQSIRKDWREMTTSEKTAYVDALNEIWNSATSSGDPSRAIMILANAHNAFPAWDLIHGNRVFLPWHRLFLEEMEDSLQSIDPDITIPYWDWRDDNSTSSSLWDDLSAGGFLGEFDTDWSLNRDRGVNGSLPGQSVYNTTMDIANFDTFAGTGYGTAEDPGDLELDLHNSIHNWVGGDMSFMTISPTDPVFYLHHALVDMFWQDWEDEHSGSSFSSNIPSGARYSGYNPSTIIDSGPDLDIWYAKDNAVHLHDITVSTSGDKIYRYTSGTMTVDDNFTIPSGANVTMEVGEHKTIVLGPGFSALSGSTFRAYPVVGAGPGASISEFTPVIADQIDLNNEDQTVPLEYSLMPNFPNPFNPVTTIEYTIKEPGAVTLTVYNLRGAVVQTLVRNSNHDEGHFRVQFDGRQLASGVYFYRIITRNFSKTNKMLLLK